MKLSLLERRKNMHPQKLPEEIFAYTIYSTFWWEFSALQVCEVGCQYQVPSLTYCTQKKPPPTRVKKARDNDTVGRQVSCRVNIQLYRSQPYSPLQADRFPTTKTLGNPHAFFEVSLFKQGRTKLRNNRKHRTECYTYKDCALPHHVEILTPRIEGLEPSQT